MTKLFCFLFIFQGIAIMPFHAFSQTDYFNKRYDFYGGWEGAVGIIENLNDYMVSGEMYDTSSHKSNVAIWKINKTGDVISKKSFGAAPLKLYSGNSDALVQTTDGGYVVGGGANLTGNHSVSMLVRLDFNGDSIWMKFYGDTAKWQVTRQCKQTHDKGFILTGTIDTIDPNNPAYNDILLIKTDSLGNEQWHKAYNAGSVEDGYSVDLCPDGGYIIGGNTNAIGAGLIDAYIIKTDSLGNEEWHKTFGGGYNDQYANMKATMDSGYIISYSHGIEIGLGGYTSGQIRFVKLDKFGGIQWSKLYGESRIGTGAFTIAELTDGSFVTCGQTTDTTGNHVYGVLLKVNSAGEQIWYREYELLTGLYSQNYLYDFKPTSDGGFVCAGMLFSSPPDTGTDDIWVIKVDSMGCPVENCMVGIGNEIQNNNTEIWIYPNPTSGKLTISSSEKLDRIEIFNVLGENVYFSPSPVSEIDLSKEPDGIYFVRAKKGYSTFTEKIILSK